MRARYAAYALGKTQYIMDTTAVRRADEGVWRAEIKRFSAYTLFHSLEIRSFEDGESVAYVTFRAGLTQGEVDASFTEKSRFIRRDRWYYADGIRISDEHAAQLPDLGPG